MGCYIHPTAVIAPGARLGDNIRIGPYCVVDAHVQIGDDTVLEAFVRIRDYVEIGRGCHLYENSVLGGLPQDHYFKGDISWVRLGDGVVCRENVTIHRGSGEGTETVVGDSCMIMEGVHLGHNTRLGARCILTNKVGLSGYVEVGEGSVLGGNAGFHQFIKIGRFCMVGGLSKVIKDVPPFCLADGHPNKIYGLNIVGLRRNGFDPETRKHIKRIYHMLYREKMGIKESVERVLKTWPGDAIVEEIAGFVRSSKRGLAPWCLTGNAACREDDNE